MIVTRYLGSHLEDILTNCRLKVSRVSKLNDPFEFRYKIVGKLKGDVAVAYYRRRLENEEFIRQIRNHNKFRGMSDLGIKHYFQENITTIIDTLLDSETGSNKQVIDDVTDTADGTVRVICFSNPTQKKWKRYCSGHIIHKITRVLGFGLIFLL